MQKCILSMPASAAFN